MAKEPDLTRGGLASGPDGRERCWWGVSTPEYLAYHDGEWGRPVADERGIFERLTLEAFQSGLSWLTILRKRENFRAAFAGFEIDRVARFDDADVARLMADAGIVRNRLKVTAAITNARAAQGMLASGDSLAGLVWSYRRDGGGAPESVAEVPATTDESKLLAGELKRRGFAFVGPTTVYSTMQACGVVNDHLAGCCVRREVELLRR
ncbi:MAG TPA: DNA-3-methyladenine glycosylase I [Gaiellales bacterium]|nr:DNA-3-methyladenine glycosylase I [Gaiellales bacterium]